MAKTSDPVGVHVTHCCLQHGCKYGGHDCPVQLGHIKQRYPCEFCEEEAKTVTIDRALYKQLVKDSNLLAVLEQLGVDNWEGWSEAIALTGEDE